MKRTAALLVSVMLVVSILVATNLAFGDGDGGRPPPGAPSGSPVAGSSTTASASPEPDLAVESLAFGEPGSPSPVNQGGQSRLWFNDGSWWGVFPMASGGDHRIHRLDTGAGRWHDTGVVVDDRTYARMDVLWDGVHLVAASAGPDINPRHALRIVRFSYDPGRRAYLRDANFPVPISDHGVEGVTLTRAADGRLWVAYRIGSRVALDHTVDGDLAWRGPFVPQEADGSIERAVIASIGDRVAIVWTRPLEDQVSVAWHQSADPTDAWQTGPPATVPGLSLGEDDLGVTVDASPGAERLLAVVRTSADAAPSRGRLDPQLVLVEFRPGTEPISHLVGRVEDKHADAIALVDAEARVLYVVAASPERGGSIYYKRTSLDDVSFAPGLGTVLVPASEELQRIGGPTSTKQTLDADSGLLVAAVDARAGKFAFGSLGIDSATATPSDPGPGSAAVPLFESTFDGLAVGEPVPGWVLEGEPLPRFIVSVLSGTDSSGRLSSTATSARACAAFPAADQGELRVDAEFLFNLSTAEDVNLIQLRGAGEVASIRLRDQEIAYFDGATRIRSEVELAPGRWYRSVITLDLAAQTFTLELRDAATDVIVLQDDGLGWRSTESSTVNRICAELPPAVGFDLYLDDIRVTATTGEGD